MHSACNVPLYLLSTLCDLLWYTWHFYVFIICIYSICWFYEACYHLKPGILMRGAWQIAELLRAPHGSPVTEQRFSEGAQLFFASSTARTYYIHESPRSEWYQTSLEYKFEKPKIVLLTFTHEYKSPHPWTTMTTEFPTYVFMKPAPVHPSYTIRTPSCPCPVCSSVSPRPNMLITIKNKPVVKSSIPARLRLNPPRYSWTG